MKSLPTSWFAADAVELAPKLLGKIVRYKECEGIIVETEAYTDDAASHAARRTPRSQIMFDTYGHWYVYFTYGMHFCANVTTNKDGVGAVLIRAVEPTKGIQIMEERRQSKTNKDGTEKFAPLALHQLCSGPAKFCKAFDITKAENGLPIADAFTVYDAPDLPSESINVSPRIGISQGKDLPWRFYIKDNPFVSRKS